MLSGHHSTACIRTVVRRYNAQGNLWIKKKRITEARVSTYYYLGTVELILVGQQKNVHYYVCRCNSPCRRSHFCADSLYIVLNRLSHSRLTTISRFYCTMYVPSTTISLCQRTWYRLTGLMRPTYPLRRKRRDPCLYSVHAIYCTVLYVLTRKKDIRKKELFFSPIPSPTYSTYSMSFIHS